jgi:hypothetical protein
MSQLSVYEKFGLSPLANGSFTALGIDHPLQLVPALDAEHQIVVCFDCDENKRVKMDGVFRTNSDCTHAYFWLVSRDAGAQCFSFSAACVADTLVDGLYVRRLRPDLQDEYRSLYGSLKHKYGVADTIGSDGNLRSWRSVLTKKFKSFEKDARLALDRNLKECVQGIVYQEPFRVADVSLVLSLSKKQWQQAAHETENWRSNPPLYQVRSIEGKNCAAFVWAVLAAAEVSQVAPLGFLTKPWPVPMMNGIERAARRKLVSKHPMKLSPRSVTAEMLIPARALFEVRRGLDALAHEGLREKWGKDVDMRLGMA